MIFSDERMIYCDEQDQLSVELENKSRDEIYDILEGYSKILVEDVDFNYTALQRVIKLLCYFLVPLLFVVSLIKWVATGDRYIDSWVKRIGLTKLFKKYFA